MPSEDQRYLGRLVARRTGVSQSEAEAKVAAIYARLEARLRQVESAARDSADKARKATAYGALWLFVSLLIGAFVASLAAAHGGRQHRRI